MGREVFSREVYKASCAAHVPAKGSATARAEQRARETGKLHPLVDPAGYDVIRRSLPRFEQRKDKYYLMTVGTPMPIETRVDTTGSMGENVDVALRVLPKAFELFGDVLPDYDLQVATGIFGDVADRFVLCRPQFEMEADKIVEQLTLMVPEKDGGDIPEDPHYGLFGAAYLTDAYLHRIGLKSYDFTVSDAPARERFDARQLIRIFGDEVFEKVAENGHRIDRKYLPTTAEVVCDLLKRSHAFFLQVGEMQEATRFWTDVFGADRVILLPSTEVLPQVQAIIIGLTEGTLSLTGTLEFLTENEVSQRDATRIVRSVANIPIGAQSVLPNYSRRPMRGDLFAKKTDLWPVDHVDVPVGSSDGESDPPDGPDWL